MAYRTRSKRPLRDVPLDLLEAELRAPDITPDMYDSGSTHQDREWTDWLRGLMTTHIDNEGVRACVCAWLRERGREQCVMVSLVQRREMMKMIQSTTSWLRRTNQTWRIIEMTRPSASPVSLTHTH